MRPLKKIFIAAGIYLCLVIVGRYVISPEKYIYGHQYENKFLEFILIVLVIPASAFLFVLAKSSKKDRAIGAGILFLLSGFAGMLLLTFLEKSIVTYQLNHEGKVTLGTVDYTYRERKGSNRRKKYYSFMVSFKVNDQNYYSLPGFTDKEIYKIGDTITVRYLDRDPFLNEIFYKKERDSQIE